MHIHSIQDSDDACDRLQLARSHHAVRALFFLNGFLFATWATRIPAIQSCFSLDDGQLGLSLMAIAMGAVVAMPLAGRYCSKFSSKTISIAGVIAYLVGLPALALAPILPAFILALFTFGAAHGALDVAMNVQAVELEHRRRQPIMSAIHALWSLGGLAGAIAGGWLAANNASIATHFAVVSALLGLAVIPISSRLINGRASGKSSSDETSSSTERETVGNDRARGRILALGIMAFCVMACEGAMADWSAVMLHTVLGASEGGAAMGYAAFAIAMAGGRFVGDSFTQRLGARKQVRISGSLAVTGIVLIVTSAQYLTAIVGFVCVGAGLSTIVPVVFSTCGQLKGVSPGTALATVSTIGYFGFLLGPPLIGFVAEVSELRIALSTLLLTSLTTVILASHLKRKSPRLDAKQCHPEHSDT
ncbi:MAG: MFS transporter [Phycisphaera sp. RhM]|nr:MFS transporter [Phycisphaera sp. RhM]